MRSGRLHRAPLHRAAFGATALLVAAGLSACHADSGSTDAKSNCPRSLLRPTRGSVAHRSPGTLATVTSIVGGASADPHSFRASPSDTAEISDAALVIYNGGGYDLDRRRPRIAPQRQRRRRIFTAGQGFTRRTATPNEHVFTIWRRESRGHHHRRPTGHHRPGARRRLQVESRRFQPGADAVEHTGVRHPVHPPARPLWRPNRWRTTCSSRPALTDKTPADFLRRRRAGHRSRTS